MPAKIQSAVKPRVLFITRNFPPTLGGMERFAYDINSALKKKTQVETLKWGGSKYWLPIVLPYFVLKGVFILATKKTDVIHVQDGVASSVGVVLKFLFRKPLCIVVHGLDVTYKIKFYQFFIKRALGYADHVICNSNSTREQVLARGIEPGKVTFQPLGVEDNMFMANKHQAREYLSKKLNIDQDKKVILYAGRLVKRKGGQWFVENVLPNLVKKDKKVLFVLSGGGPEQQIIENVAEKTGMASYVRVLGRTSDEVHKNLFNGADVFVMPNIKVRGDMEGFGIVLLEAALCELPIVAARIEGIKDAIQNNKNGVLVESKNKDEFAANVQHFLSNSQAGSKFGKSARQYVLKNNGWSTIARKYIEIYAKLSREVA